MLSLAYFIVAYVKNCNLFWTMDDQKEPEAHNLLGASCVCTKNPMCIEVIRLRIALHPVFSPGNDFEA